MSPVTRHPSLIFLLGFMGSGKSTLGPVLAEAMDYDFVDTDELIERQSECTVAEIFTEKGEAIFRRYERDILRSLFRRKKMVIACGGGLPCFFDNMEQMNAHGITVYLQATPELLAQRLEDHKAEHRPLLQDKTGEELRLHIAQMLEQREQHYTKATIVVEALHASLPVLIKQLSSS